MTGRPAVSDLEERAVAALEVIATALATAVYSATPSPLLSDWLAAQADARQERQRATPEAGEDS